MMDSSPLITLAQTVVNGLAVGAVYAALAMALAVVYRGTRVVNFAQADIAMVSIQEQDRRNGQWGWRRQPVFCLLRATLLPGLRDFIAHGGRKIDAWTASQATVAVPFDDAHAFTNANTLEQLRALQP